MSTDPSSVDTGPEVIGTEADKINTGALGTLVAVGLFAMLSITAAVTALVRHDIELEEASKDADANLVVAELKATQRDTLSGPAHYVDRGKGLVSLPIDLAKGLVVAELARDPNSATPPAPPKPTEAAEVASGSGGSGSGGAAGSGGSAGKGAPEAAAGGAATSKPEPGREVQKPAPGNANKPSPVPTPTPTAATPGAQAPGPTNK